MKRYIVSVFYVILLVILLTGCQKQGKLNEGECKLDVVLTGLPDSFVELPDCIKALCEVEVTLKNISNEKLYTMLLNNTNGFEAQASLNPGTYEVESCFVKHGSILFFTTEPKIKSFTLHMKKGIKIEVEITDSKELEKYISNLVPTSKIIKADIFSRLIQIDGKVIKMKDILNKNLSVFKNMTIPIADIYVEPSKSYKILGDGIIVEVYNASAKSLNVAKCNLISIELRKNIAVLPKGFMIGLNMKEVCNDENGLYKTPSNLYGPLTLVNGWDDLTCIYSDELSGDKISIRFNCNGWFVDNVKYQFEVYE